MAGGSTALSDMLGHSPPRATSDIKSRIEGPFEGRTSDSY